MAIPEEQFHCSGVPVDREGKFQEKQKYHIIIIMKIIEYKYNC